MREEQRAGVVARIVSSEGVGKLRGCDDDPVHDGEVCMEYGTGGVCEGAVHDWEG